jgi:hypothetical protein
MTDDYTLGAPRSFSPAPEAAHTNQETQNTYLSAFAPDRSAPAWESFPEFTDFRGPQTTSPNPNVNIDWSALAETFNQDYQLGTPSAPQESLSSYLGGPTYPSAPQGYLSELPAAPTTAPGYFSGLSGTLGDYFGGLGDGGGPTSSPSAPDSVLGSPVAPSLNLSSLYNLSDFLDTTFDAPATSPYVGAPGASVRGVAPPTFGPSTSGE